MISEALKFIVVTLTRVELRLTSDTKTAFSSGRFSQKAKISSGFMTKNAVAKASDTAAKGETTVVDKK